jgi:hypothetical protein
MSVKFKKPGTVSAIHVVEKRKKHTRREREDDMT